MSQFVDVPEFFSAVYLVDFSPSLCEVAKQRFKRLGWDNCRVVCEDARRFRLEDYENATSSDRTPLRSPALGYFAQKRPEFGGADLITMSYSLSMMVSLPTRATSYCQGDGDKRNLTGPIILYSQITFLSSIR
jgi:betaine lipid synthase